MEAKSGNLYILQKFTKYFKIEGLFIMKILKCLSVFLLLIVLVGCTLKVNIDLWNKENYIPSMKEEKYYYTYAHLKKLYKNIHLNNVALWGILESIQPQKNIILLRFLFIKNVNSKNGKYKKTDKVICIFLKKKSFNEKFYEMRNKICKMYLTRIIYNSQKKCYVGKLKYIRFFTWGENGEKK